MNKEEQIPIVEIPLERDGFMRTLIRHLSGTLQDVIGLEEASGFVNVVGQRVGEEINNVYKNALQLENLSRQEVAQVMVDLKRRIKGDFFIIEESDDKIVLGNRRCPFEDKVLGRQSMCMMTSNVFGVISAENLGYSKVELVNTIADGDAECKVIVHLNPESSETAESGREYFKT